MLFNVILVEFLRLFSVTACFFKVFQSKLSVAVFTCPAVFVSTPEKLRSAVRAFIRNINSHFPYPLSIVFYLSLISGGTQIGVVTPSEFKITLYVFIRLGSFLFCAAH